MRFRGVDATVAQNYEDGGWATEGRKVNPLSGDLLADTGVLAQGIYDFTIIHYCNQSGGYADLQHRDAANSANLHYHRLFIPSLEFIFFPIWGLKIATNERLRSVLTTNLTGEIQTSIIYVKRV